MEDLRQVELTEFCAGTKAVASDVNNNFNELLKYCNYLETEIQILKTLFKSKGELNV